MKTPRFIDRLLGMRPIRELEKGFSADADDGKRIVTHEEVYRFIRKHSTAVERLDPRKMVEMTIWANAMLLQPDDNWQGVDVKDNRWRFYPDFLDWFVTPKRAKNRKTRDMETKHYKIGK